MAPVWAELAAQYSRHGYVQVGKIDCMESGATCENFDVKQYPHLMWIVNGRIVGVTSNEQTLEQLQAYVEKMVLTENHDPGKFTRREKVLPVARITEETFETFLERDIVFVNYFASWCGHCMQLSPLWTQLGERFRNDSRVLIADVDCARSKDICVLEKITVLPTLVLYKQKKIINTETGGKPLDSLVALVQEQLDGAGNVLVKEDTTQVPLDGAAKEDNTDVPLEGAGNILVKEDSTDVPLGGAANIIVKEDTTEVPLGGAANIIIKEDTTKVPLDGAANTIVKEDTTEVPLDGAANIIVKEDNTEVSLDGAANIIVKEDTTEVPLDGAANIIVKEDNTEVSLDGAANIIVKEDTTEVPLDGAANIIVIEDTTDVPLDGAERKDDTTNSSGDSTIATDKDVPAKDEL